MTHPYSVDLRWRQPLSDLCGISMAVGSQVDSWRNWQNVAELQNARCFFDLWNLGNCQNNISNLRDLSDMFRFKVHLSSFVSIRLPYVCWVHWFFFASHRHWMCSAGLPPHRGSHRDPGASTANGRLVRRPFVAMVAAGGYGGNKQDVAWLRVTVFVGVFFYLLLEINVDLQHLQRFSISKILNWRFTWDLSISIRWSHILLWPSSETLQPNDKRLGNTGWITRVHGGCTSHGCTVNIDEHRWRTLKSLKNLISTQACGLESSAEKAIYAAWQALNSIGKIPRFFWIVNFLTAWCQYSSIHRRTVLEHWFWTCYSVTARVDGEDMFGLNSSQVADGHVQTLQMIVFSCFLWCFLTFFLCPRFLPSSTSLLGICHAMSSGIYTANLPIAPLTEGRLVA